MAEQEDGTLQPGGFSPAKGLFIYLRYMFVFSLKCITGFKDVCSIFLDVMALDIE